eukprot:GHVH01014592.1.p2 GENE.GHVH01014592.1~~GHVH01014592.1.p2  ORF type:complete len:337 (+),score=97.96 GHVH01014592.1:2131-3141(+)
METGNLPEEERTTDDLRESIFSRDLVGQEVVEPAEDNEDEELARPRMPVEPSTDENPAGEESNLETHGGTEEEEEEEEDHQLEAMPRKVEVAIKSEPRAKRLRTTRESDLETHGGTEEEEEEEEDHQLEAMPRKVEVAIKSEPRAKRQREPDDSEAPEYADMDKVRKMCLEFITPENVHTMTVKLAKKELGSRFNASYDEIDLYRSQIHVVIKAVGTEMAEMNDNDGEEEEEEEEKAKAKASPKKGAPKKGLKKAQARLMSKKQFVADGSEYDLILGTFKEKIKPKEFNTGSCGWGLSRKVAFNVGDKELQCQLSVNCIVVGSKQWKSGEGDDESD